MPKTPSSRIEPRRVVVALAAALAVAAFVALVSRPTVDAAAPSSGRIEALAGRPLLAVALPPGLPGAGTTTSARDVAALKATVEGPDAGGDAWLALAAAQLAAGEPTEARLAVERSRDLADPRAEVALALVDYEPADPDASLDRVKAAASLVVEPPDARLFARYHAAVVTLWTGRVADASAALRELRQDDPESFYGVKADDLLHPGACSGYPGFVPEDGATPLSLDQAKAAAEAADAGVEQLVRYGAELVRAGRRREAAEVFARAVAIDPLSRTARVGRAIASFSKDDIGPTMSTVGPIVREQPRDPMARFHLGLVLLWLGQRDVADSEFRQVLESAPGSIYAKLAEQLRGAGC